MQAKVRFKDLQLPTTTLLPALNSKIVDSSSSSENPQISKNLLASKTLFWKTSNAMLVPMYRRRAAFVNGVAMQGRLCSLCILSSNAAEPLNM